MKIPFNLLILILFFSINVSAQTSGEPPCPLIPHFQFFKLNNRVFTDNDLPKGKMVLIMFIDPDCEHCQLAMNSIGQQYSAFRKTDIFLISISGFNKINQFMSTFGSKLKGKGNVTLLQDKQQQFISKFHPARYPAMFLYSSEKKLLDYEDNPESVFRLVNTINKNQNKL
ncbi:MAG: peroxiredoxin family protein [Ginsengibacter sp.]